MTQAVAIGQLQSFDDVNMNEAKARGLVSAVIKGLNLPKSIQEDFENLMIKLFKTTKIVAGELVNIGRIIFAKLFQFLKENPNMALGTILGAILGSFLNMVPLIGSILNIVATFLGAAIGAYLDYVRQGCEKCDNALEKVIAGASHATKEFFKLLKEIFIALRSK